MTSRNRQMPKGAGSAPASSKRQGLQVLSSSSSNAPRLTNSRDKATRMTLRSSSSRRKPLGRDDRPRSKAKQTAVRDVAPHRPFSKGKQTTVTDVPRRGKQTTVTDVPRRGKQTTMVDSPKMVELQPPSKRQRRQRRASDQFVLKGRHMSEAEMREWESSVDPSSEACNQLSVSSAVDKFARPSSGGSTGSRISSASLSDLALSGSEGYVSESKELHFLSRSLMNKFNDLHHTKVGDLQLAMPSSLHSSSRFSSIPAAAVAVADTDTDDEMYLSQECIQRRKASNLKTSSAGQINSLPTSGELGSDMTASHYAMRKPLLRSQSKENGLDSLRDEDGNGKREGPFREFNTSAKGYSSPPPLSFGSRHRGRRAKRLSLTSEVGLDGADTSLSHRLSFSPQPGSGRRKGGLLVSPPGRGSPSAESLARRDLVHKDLGEFLTTPYSPFLEIMAYFTYMDLLSVKRVCKSWCTLIESSPDLCQEVSQFEERWDLFKTLKMRERRPDFLVGHWLHKQPAIDVDMRMTLINWLHQVNREFDNNIGTLFLAVRLLDRYLDRAGPVTRNFIQLLGVAALLVASKLEETHFPDLEELLYLCDNAYDRRQLLRMEESLMNALNHCLHMPCTHTFLFQMLDEFPVDPETRMLCMYLAEQSLLDYSIVRDHPSLVATAIYINASDLRKVNFDNILEFSGYNCADLLSVSVALYNLSSNEKAVFKSQRHAPGNEELDQHIIANQYRTKETFFVADRELSRFFVDRLMAHETFRLGCVQRMGGDKV